jgi:putative two-component system protein, hydrogenase maturation factor HypX/HoxX
MDTSRGIDLLAPETIGRPLGGPGRLRILLLCTRFDALTQRAWAELTAAGHAVGVQRAIDDDTVRAAVATADPDLVICPFLRERIPPEVWRNRRTVVVRPGPRGDRGPTALDWAIMDAEPVWGVTALQAVTQLDAGPIWASIDFPLTGEPPSKSTLYTGPVADVAMRLLDQVVAAASDPGFVPEPLDYRKPDVRGRLRPPARQADRAFSWSDPAEHVLRRIRAADGAPGVHTTLYGEPVAVFDAHRGMLAADDRGLPGTVAARRDGAVLVRTGTGGVWVGQLRSRLGGRPPKLPATSVLAEHLVGVPEAPDTAGFREIGYWRDARVGVLTFRFYNGAMSTGQCRRLRAALQHAVAQDTQVLVLRGGYPFANGIHLGVIEAAADPAREAWDNIVAINNVCQEIITCAGQIVVCSVAGNAGGGGVMLALGADRVVLREGVVLNPHHATMGLYGSGYWTYVLPRRVGEHAARSLAERCLPVCAADALRIGLADAVLPGGPAAFEDAVFRYATSLASSPDLPELLVGKRAVRAADERRRPLCSYRSAELIEMSADILDDRHGFAHTRRSFLRARPAPLAAVATAS